MQKPKKFTVWFDRKKTFFETNNEDLAFKKSVIFGGTVYVDTRYLAKVRLYNYLYKIR